MEGKKRVRVRAWKTRLFRIETGGDPGIGAWKCLQRALSLLEREARELEALVLALAGWCPVPAILTGSVPPSTPFLPVAGTG